MALFQKSIVEKYLDKIDESLIDRAYQNYSSIYVPKINRIKELKEEQYQTQFLQDIFGSVLGYTVDPEEGFNIELEKKNENDSKKVDGAILKEDSVLGVIELKSTKTRDLEKVKDQAFGYKNNHKGCKYVISSNFHKLRFYVDDATEYEEFDLFNLSKSEFRKFYLYLRKEGLLDKDVPKLLKEETKFHEENISKKLYKDYSSFKNKVFENFVKNNPQHDKLILFKKSQKFLDRILFILFAEDKGLIPENAIPRIVKSWSEADDLQYKPLYDLFKIFFGHLNVGHKYKKTGYEIPAYNGGLFAPDEVLDNIIVDDEVLKDDLLILSKYDFNSEVDVNILGHIFEHSLSEIEEVEAKLRGEVSDKSKSKRKKDGVFYTPKYITKYIVDNTVGKLCLEKRDELGVIDEEYAKGRRNRKKDTIQTLSKNLEEYRNWLLNITICDPACGSGAFLNQALEFLIKEHQYIDELESQLLESPIVFNWVEDHILEKNLFGVDINEESVEIARLSLWLRTAKKGRKLTSLNNNIKCGNSLIDDADVAGDKAFKWEVEFPDIFENGGFDVIIGNPPYGAKIGKNDVDYLIGKYNGVVNGEVDTYIIFYLLSSNITNKSGVLGFITPDTWLTISRAKGLRKTIEKNHSIYDVHDWYKPFSDAKDTRCHSICLRCNVKENSDFNVTVVDAKGIELKSYRLNSDILKDYDQWNLYTSPLEKEIFLKMTSRSTNLEVKYNIKYGLRTGNNEKYLTKDRGLSEKGIKIARGSNIENYFFNWEPEYLITDEGLPTSYFEDEILNNPKIIIQYVRTNSTARDCRWLESALIDENNFVPLNSTSFIYPKESNYNLKFLLCILSSYLMNYFYKAHYTDVNVKPLYLAKLPVPDVNEEIIDVFTLKADEVMNKNKELNRLSNSFIQLIRNNLNINPNTRIFNWYILEFSEFIKEIEKIRKKASKENETNYDKLSLSEEARWMQYFNEEKQKAQELKQQINQTDKEIDQMVYELYGLTEEEIKIVEEN